VQVLYCTKQIDKLDAYSFIIDDASDMTECGLYLETLVVTNRITGMPWMPPFFARRPRDNRGPVVGRMTPALQAKVLALRPGF
jgi:hypothetical protein